ncbi:hypothetical protein CDAR_80511, partial [Caerostris darwini]
MASTMNVCELDEVHNFITSMQNRNERIMADAEKRDEDERQKR